MDKAGLYGSLSCGEEKTDSDIDIIIRNSLKGISLKAHVHIMNTLSDKFGRQEYLLI